MAALPASARTARTTVRSWLESARWPDAPTDDIVYAVSEAVTNSVEHAYRPSSTVRTIGLELRVECGSGGSQRVRVRVSDRGRWRTPPPDGGCRGHGLALMRAIMDEVVVGPGRGVCGGTEVMLLSPSVAGAGGDGAVDGAPDR